MAFIRISNDVASLKRIWVALWPSPSIGESLWVDSMVMVIFLRGPSSFFFPLHNPLVQRGCSLTHSDTHTAKRLWLWLWPTNSRTPSSSSFFSITPLYHSFFSIFIGQSFLIQILFLFFFKSNPFKFIVFLYNQKSIHVSIFHFTTIYIFIDFSNRWSYKEENLYSYRRK